MYSTKMVIWKSASGSINSVKYNEIQQTFIHLLGTYSMLFLLC